jgi:hypothetical protein
VKPYPWVLYQKLFHVLGLVRGEVIQHDVDLFGPSGSRHQPIQKGDELFGGVTTGSHPLHLASLNVQSRV